MRKLGWLVMSLALLCGAGSKDCVELAGARWESSWDLARQRAVAEGKPILLLDMVGRLDEKWC